jgi:hypothetical protein
MAEKAISVAHGIAQPRLNSAVPSVRASETKMSAGAAMPPTAAASGDTAVRGEASAPPGRVASKTSFAARAKKKAMPTSLTQKWSGSASDS